MKMKFLILSLFVSVIACSQNWDAVKVGTGDCDSIMQGNTKIWEKPEPLPFIMTVSMSASESMTVPFYNTTGYNCTIDWGDGSALSTITTYDDADRVHTYTNAGSYDIKINGTCKGISFLQDNTNSLNLTKVKEWGDVGFITAYFMFYNTVNLDSLPSGAMTGVSNISDLSGMFRACSGLDSIPIGIYDNVSDLSIVVFSGTFQDCTGLTSIPSGLFDNFTNTNANSVFQNTFNGCTGLTSIPSGLFDLNVSLASSAFYATFQGCTGLSSIPSSLFDFNTSVNNSAFFSTFEDCTGLTSIPSGLFDNNTSVGTTGFSETFRGCINITSIPSNLFDYNTSATSFQNTFYGCTGITSIPTGLFNNNTSVTSFTGCFRDCTGLTSIPSGLFDNNTSVTSFVSTFRNCTSLGGAVDDIWNDYPTASGTDCFLNCTGLTNYASIPTGWK